MASRYPAYIPPRASFMERMKSEADPEWLVKDLQFIQWSKGRWSAQWRWGRVGDPFTTEMSLGGAERTLEDIERRLLYLLKPEVDPFP